MSRKHFELLARALRHNAPDSSSPSYDAEALMFTRIVADIADACRASNARFSHDRFVTASGLPLAEVPPFA
jgi:hypothetical protein